MGDIFGKPLDKKSIPSKVSYRAKIDKKNGLVR